MEQNQLVMHLIDICQKNYVLGRVNIAFSRAAASAARRTIDPTIPRTWEFRGFSQNFEDGIIDYLCDRILNPSRYFIEIGASDALENNTSWLALGRSYIGLMIEGDPKKAELAKVVMETMNRSVRVENIFVSRENMPGIVSLIRHPNPDVLSVDIDGMDYYVADDLFSVGCRPSILVLEYNASFGPEASVTVPYSPDFSRLSVHPSGYYHGVSLTGWRHYLAGYGYRFLTVDSEGVNSFFVLPERFDPEFIRAVKGVEFANNRYRGEWRQQYEVIKHLPVLIIDERGKIKPPTVDTLAEPASPPVFQIPRFGISNDLMPKG